MQSGKVRREIGVSVTTQAIEGHVSQIEQPGIADNQVEGKRQDTVKRKVTGDTNNVIVIRSEGYSRSQNNEQSEAQPKRDTLPLLGQPEPCSPRFTPPLNLSDPLVTPEFFHPR